VASHITSRTIQVGKGESEKGRPFKKQQAEEKGWEAFHGSAQLRGIDPPDIQLP